MPEQHSFWLWAEAAPERVALVLPSGESRSAGELLTSCHQVANGLLQLGLVPGSTVAVALPNGAPIFELFLAAMQCGFYITPLNIQLTAPEMAYVLEDAGADVFFASAVCGEASREAAERAGLDAGRCFGTDVDAPFQNFGEWKTAQPSSRPEKRSAGQMLQYTSGTTGRPKGVRRALQHSDPDEQVHLYSQQLARFGIQPGGDNAHLCGSPMYHLAALAYSWFSLHWQHRIVLMEKWQPEPCLAAIAEQRVTTVQMVPTQFHRLLALPDEVKRAYDTSSLTHVLHAGAPCPVDVKRRMIEWWGPVIYEYYGASEGGGTLVTSEEWLERPGTVGKPWVGADIRIYDDEKQLLPAGEVGNVYLKLLGEFEYGGDARKTADARIDDYFTAGDMGYLDAEGYLYLCDRKSEMVISGGVNIYPAEVEAALLQHPAVGDVAVFGIPDPEWGEQLKAVVEPTAGTSADAALAEELLEHCARELAKYKRPRSLDFAEALPRDPNGKLYRRKLRDPYWQGKTRNI